VRPEPFGDFLLVQPLSTTSMAEAFVAVRLGERSGRTYVIKRPRLGERASGRAAQAILREAEVLEARLAPGLLPLEAAGTIAGLPYLAIEHLRAVSVEALIHHGGALGEGPTRVVASELARTLARLHEAGWVHRDVAPGNVLIDDEGSVRLIDLGLAAHEGTKAPEIVGTAGYAAPEAVRAIEVHRAQDVYGFGAVIAECALGRPLFPERELYEAAARSDTKVNVDGLALDLASDVGACLARDPLARPSMRTLAERLTAAPPQDAALERAALAERVLRALEAPRSVESGLSAPTKTWPDAALAPSMPPSPPPRTLPESANPTALGRAPRNAWRAIAVGLLIVFAGVGGLAAGRRSVRARDASITFAGTLPRRTTLELDGKVTTPTADNSPMPLSAGSHRLVVALRGERRQYVFRARPGEQVVVVPLLVPQGRAGGTPEPPNEGSRD
jgi:serine/threonine-protein kinase